MSQELLIVSEKVHLNKRKISKSSHNIYLEVPSGNGYNYSPLINPRDYNMNTFNNNGRQRSSSMTTSPVKLANSHKPRRRRSLSPRLTAKSNSNILETIQRRSSVNSIATTATNRTLQPKQITKRINILVIGGENAGKACLAEYLNGSSISSSCSSDEWGGELTLSFIKLSVYLYFHPSTSKHSDVHAYVDM
ncbi:unnamed protein product [Allacma fusca]|uniref:Uncharacterized protein n=1 Tax=Allacma fusca TaxID=39272 RepID=A0A8J2JEF2_9HEXA|nr:unnamed protein product [Allacma fusca]